MADEDELVQRYDGSHGGSPGPVPLLEQYGPYCLLCRGAPLPICQAG